MSQVSVLCKIRLLKKFSTRKNIPWNNFDNHSFVYRRYIFQFFPTRISYSETCHLVALVKIWGQWNEKKVGKYEKILSCIDRSKYVNRGTSSTSCSYLAFSTFGNKKKKEEICVARALRISIFSCSCFFFFSSRMNNILLHASRFLSC